MLRLFFCSSSPILLEKIKISGKNVLGIEMSSDCNFLLKNSQNFGGFLAKFLVRISPLVMGVETKLKHYQNRLNKLQNFAVEQNDVVQRQSFQIFDFDFLNFEIGVLS
jgi:hypothetical protein